MNPSEFDSYKETVTQNLRRITEILAKISADDFSDRIDITTLPDNEFLEVFCGLDLLMDDLLEARADLQRQNEMNALRARVWQISIEPIDSEEEFLTRIFALIGEFFTVARVSYYGFDAHADAVCRVQWCAPGYAGTPSLRIPAAICHHFRNQDHVVVSPETVPVEQRNAVLSLFQQTGISSFLALFYPDTHNPQGFFSLSHPDSARVWGQGELQMLREIVHIYSSRISRNRAEEALRRANERLEKRVRKRTDELYRANSRLQEDIKVFEQKEYALKESEQRFRAVAENAHEAIITADSKGTIVYSNKGTEKIFGFTPQEVQGRSISLFVPEDSGLQQRVMEKMQRKEPSEREGEVIEYWAFRKSGERFPVELSLSSWETRTDRFYTAIIRDVSVRFMAEKSLRERERFLNNIFGSIQDGISVLNRDLSIVRVNPRMEQWYGHAMPLVGKFCYAAYHGRSQPCDVCPTRTALESGNVTCEVVTKRGPDNQITGWLDLYAFPMRDPDTGELSGVIEYVRDITERKKAQDGLAQEKELLDVTLTSIADAVITLDRNGNVVLFNRTAEKCTGCREEEAVGSQVSKVCHFKFHKGGIRIETIIDRAVNEKRVQTVSCDLSLCHRDGSERLVSLAVAPISAKEDPNTGTVLVIRDITDLQLMENELFKARKLESVGLLAGGIAHDFNNILTGIVTNLFMAKMSVHGNEEAVQLINEAEKASFRASRLTKQLLTFSKGGSPVKECVSIEEIIKDSVGFCLSGSNVDASLNITNDLWAVEVDRGQIDQVINNLVINANQAMPQGGHIIVTAENIEVNDAIPSGTATALPLKPGRYVKVTVQDEGHGISSRDIEKIFDPYFTTKQQGSGLGLTTAFSIVKKHDGYMTVKSTLGKGSRFIFYLPATQPEEGPVDPANEELQPGNERVLVMDDDEVVRMVVERLLTNNGYRVSCTATGEDAVRAYAEAFSGSDPFQVVIMDLTVPGGMGGREAVKEILKTDPRARVIVFSGYSNDPVMANYREYGFSGVIAKPFSIDDFSRVLNTIMSR